MKVKIFEIKDGRNSERIEQEINMWLRAQQEKIEVKHVTQSGSAGYFPSSAGFLHVISIFYEEKNN